jgi:hypothetical protein
MRYQAALRPDYKNLTRSSRRMSGETLAIAVYVVTRLTIALATAAASAGFAM